MKKRFDIENFPFDPLSFLMETIYSDELTTKDRMYVAMQLMKFYYPTKKEFEVKTEGHSELKISWETPAMQIPNEEILTIEGE